MNPLRMIGAGGHARVVYDLVQAVQPGRTVFWHDDAWKSVELRVPIDEVRPIESVGHGQRCFVAIGNAASRMRLISQLERAGNVIESLVHPFGFFSPSAQFEAGCVFMAGSIVQSRVAVGSGVIVNTGATVDHDCVLEDGVHIAPGANIAGDVRIGKNTWIGIGAVVREGICIGSNVLVGAGAVVVSEVADESIVVGNPARIRGAAS